MEVTEIERFRNKYGVRFAGTLRNQYSFDIGQNVYIQHGGKMVECRVIGKELPPVDNSDYRYKIELPKGLFSFNDETTVSLICEDIFKSKSDAHKSALLHIERMYELDKQSIERFFTDKK